MHNMNSFRNRREFSFELKVEELKKVLADLKDAVNCIAPSDIKRDAVLHRFFSVLSITELTLRKYILLKDMEVKKKSDLYVACFEEGLLGNDFIIWQNILGFKKLVEASHQSYVKDSVYRSVVGVIKEFEYLVLRLDKFIKEGK